MFEQHPVPQQISSYSFKLVGNMNLKQFFQIASGAIIALILYAIPLPGYVQWPLIIISAVSGAAFAFVPIQDRPLEQWLFAFFRSIYSPTVFVWQESTTSHQYFRPEPGTVSISQQNAVATQIQVELDKTKQSLPSDPDFVKNLDKGEQEKLNKISNMMQGQPATATDNTYMPKGEMIGADTGAITEEVQTNEPDQSNSQNQPEELVVPVEQRVQTEKKGFNMPDNQQQAPVPIKQQAVGEVFNATNNQPTPTAEAQFSQQAAPPMPPTQANTLVGQVVDKQGNIVEGAILEIKDSQNIPVRAMKTNKAGHFMMVTPLQDGNYTIITEKENYGFETVSLKLESQIVPPIVIKSQ